MMALSRLLCSLTLGWLLVPSGAAAQERCEFRFRVDTQSTAFQALVDGAAERGGFWRPIGEAPDEVREIGRFIGRLDVCLMTQDGTPRQVQVGGRTVTLQSPHVTHCTAALLPGNRLLTNRHCYFDPTLADAGFNIVQEARVNFGYVSTDFTDDVQSFAVGWRELAQDARTDSLLLEIVGGDANAALGGHVPMVMETDPNPRRALTMIHHPRGQPQQFSSGTCQVAPEQADLPEGASQLRHTCESAGGSSGSLLLDARTLAVVGLHNQGGLGARGGYNGGHKIDAVEAVLKLGFRDVDADVSGAQAEAEAQAALAKARQIADPDARRKGLEAVVRAFPDSFAADNARFLLEVLGDDLDTGTAAPDTRAVLSSGTKSEPGAGQPGRRPAPPGTAGGVTAADVRARGYVNCAIPNMFWAAESGNGASDEDACQRLAHALLGDSADVAYVPVSRNEAAVALASGEADVLMDMSGTALEPGADGLVQAVGARDGLAFLIPKGLGVRSATELDGAVVCLADPDRIKLAVDGYFKRHRMSFEPLVSETLGEAAQHYEAGACDVLVQGARPLARIRMMTAVPEDHTILPERIAGATGRAFVRVGDPAWQDLVEESLSGR